MAVQGVLVNAYFSEYLRTHPASEELIKREYESIRTALGNREYKVRHVLLGSAAEAQAVIDKLARGEKFGDLAKQSQDRSTKDIGGDLGWINAATYVKPFSEATIKLQKGAHTLKPVQSEFGWHVIQLDDVRELKVPTLAEVKPQLVQHLQQQIVERHLADLRARAKIE
jgi:peptidyl-prolyl cis-trans isomerase C